MHLPQDFSRNWTLKDKVSLTGTGLHSGAPAKVELNPSEKPGYWLWQHNSWQKVTVQQVQSTYLCTQLGAVQTVEHLLAAVYGLGLSALHIRVEGPEVPALDGSAALFAQALLDTGLHMLESERQIFRPRTPIHWQEGDTHITCEAADQLQIHYEIKYQKAGQVLEQSQDFDWSPSHFLTEIAPARTFAFATDLNAMLASGRALGGSLENALVLDSQGYRNPPRFTNEPVRHKILDLLGDLALLGCFLQARLVLHRGGHSSHVKLVKILQEQAQEGQSP